MNASFALLCSLPLVGALAHSQLAASTQVDTLAWDQRFGTAGADRLVQGTAVYDDGSGKKLYAVGDFTSVSGVESNLVARWNGSSWEGIETPWETRLFLRDICVYDGGSGPRLFVAGEIFIDKAYLAAAWDGTDWELFAAYSGGPRQAHCLYADAESLYLGGRFWGVGGVAGKNIARYDGTTWWPMGSGRPQKVRAIRGSAALGTQRIYAGTETGGFTNTETLSAWDGSAWNPTPGANKGVSAIDEWETATGKELLVGGIFKLSRLTLGGLIPLDDGAPSNVSAIATGVENGSPTVYAGGGFTQAGGQTVNNVTRWDGKTWSALGSGTVGISGNVRTLTRTDLGAGDVLFVGGYFGTAGGTQANYIAQWNGVEWSILGSGQGLQGTVHAFEVFDGGGGPQLYAGGDFRWTEDWTVEDLVRRNKGGWEKLPDNPIAPVREVLALETWDDGSGPALFVATKTYLWRFDGTSWTEIGPSGPTWDRWQALEVWDDGSGEALFIGGAISGLARWDGVVWQDLDLSNTSFAPGTAEALEVWDDGTGEKLYVVGAFDMAGTTPVSNIAAWDGTVWTGLGAGLIGGAEFNLIAIDIPSLGGRRLVLAGNITQVGGFADVDGLAAWNGTAWEDMPSQRVTGFNYPRAVAVFDDGDGPTLYAGGRWDHGRADVARWNGKRWKDFAPAGNGIVETLFPDPRNPNRPSLWVGGSFESIAGIGATGITRAFYSPVRFTPVAGTTDGASADSGPLPRLHGWFDPARALLGFDVLGAPEGAAGILIFEPQADGAAATSVSPRSVSFGFTLTAQGRALTLAMPALDGLGPTQVRALVLDSETGLHRWTPALLVEFNGEFDD